MNGFVCEIVRFTDGTLELHKTEAYDDDISDEMALFLESYLKDRSGKRGVK